VDHDWLIVHSIALLMKDLCKFKCDIGGVAATRPCALKRAESCVEDGNNIANFLQDSSTERQLVFEKQKEVMHGHWPTIHLNVSTRQATQYHIRSILCCKSIACVGAAIACSDTRAASHVCS
jgi:hypothetical protein